MWLFIDKREGKIQPHYARGVVGESVKFTCISSITVQWFHNSTIKKDGETHTLGKTTYYKLVISNIQYHDAGIYECFGSDDAQASFQSEAMLVVTGK